MFKVLYLLIGLYNHGVEILRPQQLVHSSDVACDWALMLVVIVEGQRQQHFNSGEGATGQESSEKPYGGSFMYIQRVAHALKFC